MVTARLGFFANSLDLTLQPGLMHRDHDGQANRIKVHSLFAILGVDHSISSTLRKTVGHHLVASEHWSIVFGVQLGIDQRVMVQKPAHMQSSYVSFNGARTQTIRNPYLTNLLPLRRASTTSSSEDTGIVFLTADSMSLTLAFRSRATP